jgi:asparagine synthase (glutamine-hydrolysing)
MCGFAAAISKKGKPFPSKESVKDMQKMIAHRGPDAQGFYSRENVVLAHQRLAIIDVESPPQPMHTNDGRYSIVYNGEIYNYNELKKELSNHGVEFFTACDTEVLLKGFAYYGNRIFSLIDGMFAAVIVDHNENIVITARDRVGIKPLYVANLDDTFLFASELPAITAYSPGSFKAWDPVAIDNYMTLGYIIEPKTHIKGISQVPAANVVTYDMNTGRVTNMEYWSLKEAIHSQPIHLTQSEGENLVSESVISQMIADVKVGSFLSGGLDSSVVTAIASSNSEDRIHCYSAGFSENGFDEIPQALAFAEKINAKHAGLYFDDKVLENIDKVSQIYGGPFADNAAYPTFRLSEKASSDVKVLLSGDGADELFFGYRNHRSLFIENAVKKCIPKAVSSPLFKWLSKVYPNHPSIPRPLRAKSTLYSLSMSLSESYCAAMSSTSREILKDIYSDNFNSLIKGKETEKEFARIGSEVEHHDPMKVMQYLDFKTYLPGSVLTKVDRATMRAGVEARVPFLSNAMLDAILPQKTGKNLGFTHQKSQLREWASPWLNNEERMRKKKSFTSPLDQWFRALQYSDFYRIIMTEGLVDSCIFDIRKIDKIMRDHYQGKANHGTTLWSLSVLARTLPRP